MLEWQNLIVLALVAVAAGYILLQGWATLVTRKKACGCTGCPKAGAQAATAQTKSALPIVELNSVQRAPTNGSKLAVLSQATSPRRS